MLPAELAVFAEDDQAYLRWLARHPHGFVINTPRSTPASYMVLHRASCPSVSQYTWMTRPGGFTERAYIKVCAEQVAALRSWVSRHGRIDGTFSRDCVICKPTLKTSSSKVTSRL